MSDAAPSIVLHLPIPPSANRMWRQVPGRTKISAKTGKKFKMPVTLTDEYIAWLDAAGWEVRRQMVGLPEIAGQFRARIEYPERLRRDEDNYVKPILDLLQRVSVIRNDRGMRGHEVAPVERADCMIALWDIGGEPFAVIRRRTSFAKPRARMTPRDRKAAAIYARALIG